MINEHREGTQGDACWRSAANRGTRSEPSARIVPRCRSPAALESACAQYECLRPETPHRNFVWICDRDPESAGESASGVRRASAWPDVPAAWPTRCRDGRCSRRSARAAWPLRKNKTYNRRSQTVSTVKKSTAMRLFACNCRNWRHDGPDRPPAGPTCSSRSTFRTVVADTTTPIPFSSPTMRW